jgi:hypothetical protein
LIYVERQCFHFTWWYIINWPWDEYFLFCIIDSYLKINIKFNFGFSSVFHFTVSFMTYHWVCKRSNTSGAGTANPSGAHEFIPRFLVEFVLLDLQFYVYVLYIVVCSFSFGHCVVWLPLWYLQTFLKMSKTKKCFWWYLEFVSGDILSFFLVIYWVCFWRYIEFVSGDILSLFLVIYWVCFWWYLEFVSGDILSLFLVIYWVYFWRYIEFVSDDILSLFLVIYWVCFWWDLEFVSGDILSLFLVISWICFWWYIEFVSGDIPGIEFVSGDILDIEFVSGDILSFTSFLFCVIGFLLVSGV